MQHLLRATSIFVFLALSSGFFFVLTPLRAMAGSPYSLHFQSTVVSQGHGDITSPYDGENSLSATHEWKTSLTATLFAGRTLWKGAEIFLNPEVTGGSGLSGTHGAAGFPNGEIYRVDSPTPKLNLARLFIRQIWALDESNSSPTEVIEADQNQFAKEIPIHRISFVVGKFSLNDFLDANAYSHDPRTQFLNWGFMDNLAWDYAADTRGYTLGFVLEYNEKNFSLRLAEALEPKVANQLDYDWDIGEAHGDNLEFEYRYELGEKPGRARLLGYMNHAHMGSYAETLSTPSDNEDITLTREYRTKYGLGVNLEQSLTPDFGLFSRLGWNDGQTETWAFTEVDRTVSLGASLSGIRWQRPNDVLGVACLANWLSQNHAEYLAAGGYGFLIGDGKINYAPEEIIEIYYSTQIIRQEWANLSASLDYQFLNHPAYNADRGPANIIAGRVHYEF